MSLLIQSTLPASSSGRLTVFKVQLLSSVYLQTKLRRLTGEIEWSGSFNTKKGDTCIIKVGNRLDTLEAKNM